MFSLGIKEGTPLFEKYLIHFDVPVLGYNLRYKFMPLKLKGKPFARKGNIIFL